MKRFLLFCLFFLFFMCSSYGETVIYLKSGESFEGKLIEKTDKYVRLNLYGVELTYQMDEIERLKLDDGTLIYPKDKPEQSSPSAQFSQTTPVQGTVSVTFDPKAKGAVLAFLASFGIIIVIFGLLIYVFCAICLQAIAKKTNAPNGWMAWIPIANLILICNIAQKPLWWVAFFFLGFIPFIGLIAGPIAFAVVSVLLWIKIAELRGKPSWLGLLMLVPLVNLGVMGYIAFSN